MPKIARWASYRHLTLVCRWRNFSPSFSPSLSFSPSKFTLGFSPCIVFLDTQLHNWANIIMLSNKGKNKTKWNHYRRLGKQTECNISFLYPLSRYPTHCISESINLDIYYRSRWKASNNLTPVYTQAQTPAFTNWKQTFEQLHKKQTRIQFKQTKSGS